MDKIFRRWGRYTKDGVEILKYRILLPEYPEMPNMTGFYRSVADRVECFCKERLCEYAEQEYILSDIRQKKFNYPCIVYVLDGKAIFENGEIMLVSLKAELKKRGGSVLCESSEVHSWSVSEDCMIPPRYSAQVICPDKGHKIKNDLDLARFIKEKGIM